MKKRILSFCLLLAMVVTALPLAAMSVFAASGRASYEEEDYNTLYVQKGLVFAADFFDTNEYWGKDVAADLNAYAWTDTAAVFNTSTIPSGAVTGGYLLLNKFSDNLGVSNTASLTNLGQNGTTGEYVGVFTTTGDFAFVLNNIQINPTFADDEDGKRVMTVNKVGNYYNKADMKFRTGTGELLAFSAPSPMAVNTLTLTVDAPTYTLDYYGTTLSGVEEQATSWGVNFKVT
ncbi:MAG: hypothetical protein J6W28_00470, partial [Clostridia bacterium]|nr:hypothetical protein [Clostridia bacterium]